MKFTICYQHNDFIIINKPCGISVQLDKVTSGLLMLALNQEAASYLSQLFQNHQIQKTYWALATSKPKKKQGKIVGDMVRSRSSTWKLCHSKNNPAITRFYSRSLAPKLRHFTLLPKTGKTHQLRVAMKSLGSAILGDSLYGGEKSDRVYLHAYQIEFNYQGENIMVNALPYYIPSLHSVTNLLKFLITLLMFSPYLPLVLMLQ